MTDQLPTFGSMSSVFQLAAGVSLAMGVFRAPYERFYQRLGAILDLEEALLVGRSDEGASLQVDKVVSARVAWLIKGKEIQPFINEGEAWMWCAVAVSSGLLVVTSLWPAVELTRPCAMVLILAVVFPLALGSWKINSAVRRRFGKLEADIQKL